LKGAMINLEKALVDAKRYSEFESKYIYLCQE